MHATTSVRWELAAAHGGSCCHQAAACGGSWQPRMAGAVAIRQQRAARWRWELASRAWRWELAAAHGGGSWQPRMAVGAGSRQQWRWELAAAHGGGSWQPRMAVGAGSRAWRELLPSGSSVRWGVEESSEPTTHTNLDPGNSGFFSCPTCPIPNFCRVLPCALPTLKTLPSRSAYQSKETGK